MFALVARVEDTYIKIWKEKRELNTMKTALIIIMLFAFALPCFAELTENDIRQIRQIMREELKPIETRIGNLENKVGVLETRMGNLEKQIATIEGKMATKDDIIAVRENLGGKMATKNDIIAIYGLLIGLLIAIVVAILSIFFSPLLKKWLEGREQERDLTRVKDELRSEFEGRIVELEKRKFAK